MTQGDAKMTRRQLVSLDRVRQQLGPKPGQVEQVHRAPFVQFILGVAHYRI